MQSFRDQFAKLQYLLREKLWRHGETLCSEVVAQSNDSVFRMWRAFCLDQQGLVSDALHEYKNCDGKRDVAALTGLAAIYRRNKDTEGEQQVERLLNEDRGTNLGAWLQAACVLWHSNDTNRARDVINKVLDCDTDYRDNYTSVQLIRGWIDLSSGRGAYIEKSLSMFDKVLLDESKETEIDIDAAMGKISYLEKKNQFWPAQELQNKLIVLYPNFWPVFISKAKLLMRTENWDQVLEVIQRVLGKDPQNVEGLILSILHTLVKEARHSEAAESLKCLHVALNQREPKNAYIFHKCAQCFARLSAGSLEILNVTSKLADHAVELQPNNSEYLSDVAYQFALKGDYRAAQVIYKEASGLGDGNPSPLLGLVKCAIIAGKLEDAAGQVDFLTGIQSPQNRIAELMYLHALILWRLNKNQTASLEKLDQAVEAHKQEIASQPTGAELYVKLNPPLVIEIAREYMQHCRTEPPEPGTNKTDPSADKARRVLEMVVRHVPGSTEAQLLASKIAFIGGTISRASAMITKCIQQDSSNCEAYLLKAQIAQYTGQVANANEALEQALALDFSVKDLPQYSLLKGTILLKNGENQEALKILKAALKRVDPTSDEVNTEAPSKHNKGLGVQDHVTLYLQIAQCHINLKNMSDAKDVIHRATGVFRNTSQIGRVRIAHAVLVAPSDVESALMILRSVPSDSEYYIASKARMANIYLTQQNNRRMFAQCFEELVKQSPSVQSLTHLGEAYAAIQEPDKAIVAFERARAMNPNSTDLAIRIGRTLVATHDYQRALRYYRDAVAGDTSFFSLRRDLAILYWRLGEIAKAVQVLKESPVMLKGNPAGDEPIEDSVERVNIALLVCKILRSTPDLKEKALESLIQARVYQNALVSRMRTESSEIIYQQRSVASTICCELGETYLSINVHDKSISFYNESLKYDETNERAILALAKLYLNKGDIDSCEHKCNALMRINPSCEEALLILADLMYRRNRYEDAAQHFSQLLENKPDNFNAMVQYVQLLRRTGRLSDAKSVFTKAEKLLRHGQAPDPGLCYAQGLYYQYSNNAPEALVQFNLGRYPVDNVWSQRCLIAMTEIYIIPNNENLWEDTRTEMDAEVAANLRAAEGLLTEIRDYYRRSILQGYWFAAHKSKEYLEKALQKFFEINSSTSINEVDEDEPQRTSSKAKDTGDDSGEGVSCSNLNVPALVGMSVVLQMMNQTPKARNNLKKVAMCNYNPAEDDDYERGWLLLADIYIQSGKYDLAQELLKKAIQANKSCSRGLEYMGLIYEKEQSYKDAADFYERAWTLLGETDPAIGFKLAFNFMKAKKYVAAIDVCEKVLAKHPNYPRIEKDVLERSRLLIRQ
eukprot:Tbor_TRINITY_DN2533_c0_g1::TRINITY_DN2533_c0_g1_i1::g.560::m.560/K19673/TTC21B, IFT139; tetratricopeptide repeat protein 21B